MQGGRQTQRQTAAGQLPDHGNCVRLIISATVQQFLVHRLYVARCSRVGAGDTLTVPDFLGNFFFNTLGNQALNPRCGLLFMDFNRSALLQLAARAEIVFDSTGLRAFQGAQRLLRLQVLATRRMDAALPLRWGAAESSPYLAGTGAWQHRP